MSRKKVWFWIALAAFCFVAFCLSGCGGGFGIFENAVKMDRFRPKRYATDVSRNTAITFRVQPVRAWAYLEIYYLDGQLKRYLYASPQRIENWFGDEVVYRFTFNQPLFPNTRYYLEVEGEGYADGYKLRDAFVEYWFETGTRLEPSQVQNDDS